MLEFIVEYKDYFLVGFSFLSLLIAWLKTGNKKYIKEGFDMVFKTLKTSKDNPIHYTETFTKLLPVYRLNKATNELEKTDEVIDIHELIQSCKNDTYEAMLDRFLPNSETAEDKALAVYNTMQDDIDSVAEIVNIANDYKDKFGLDPNMSVESVFAFVQGKAKELKETITSKEVKPNEEKKTNEEN